MWLPKKKNHPPLIGVNVEFETWLWIAKKTETIIKKMRRSITISIIKNGLKQSG